MNVKKWLPNFVTLTLAALLVITQQVWADPIAARFTAATAAASSQTTINYQGYLTDSNGSAVNDTLEMSFRLYSVESGGTALWTETQSSVAVSNGLFSVLLGSVTQIPLDIFTNNTDLWLGIAVGTDGEMSPREKIASAPYAMIANVPDGSITQDKLADSAVTSSKISTDAVGSSEVANDSLTANDLAADSVGSSEIANGAVKTNELADNSVTIQKISSTIELMQIQGGDLYCDAGVCPGYNLHEGTGERTYTWHIQFPSSFNHPPMVQANLFLADSGDTGIRVRLQVQNVTQDGCDIEARTWGDSVLHGVGTAWIAYATQ